MAEFELRPVEGNPFAKPTEASLRSKIPSTPAENEQYAALIGVKNGTEDEIHAAELQRPEDKEAVLRELNRKDLAPGARRILEDHYKKTFGEQPSAVPGVQGNRGATIAAELKAKKGPKPVFPLEGEQKPAVTLKPVDFDPFAAAPAPTGVVEAAGKGLAHGTLGLAETVGTGIQFLGNRVSSPAIAELGESVSKYWASKAKPLEAPADIQGAIFDKPELLAKGSWWAYNLFDTLPSLAASIVPGMGAAKAISIGGKALELSAPVIERLAILGGSVAGGGVGGSLEGAQTYKEVLERGGTEEEAAVAGTTMALASAGLNAISVGKVLSPTGAGALRRFLTTGAVEGLTEWAEEPAEGAILSRTSVAKPEDDPLERAKQGLNVLPIAWVLGGGAGVMQGRTAPPQPAPAEPIAAAQAPGEATPGTVPPAAATPDAAAPQGPPNVVPETGPVPGPSFADQFMGKPPAPLSPIDQARVDAQVLKSGGELEGADETRTKNATLLSVYGENAAVRHVVEGGAQFSAIGDAMLMAAPTVERVRGTIQAGAERRDITNDVLGAIDELAKIRASGQSIATVMAQGIGHDISYEGQQLMQFLDENSGDSKKISAFLEAYLHEVETATGIPSEVRGRAFDIIEEQRLSRKKADEEAADKEKKRVDEGKKAAEEQKAREKKQADTAETAMLIAKASGSGIQPGHQSAMEIAFANAKKLKTKEKKNAKPSAGSAGAVQAGTPGDTQGGNRQDAGPAKNDTGAVPVTGKPDSGGDARPVRPEGNLGGAEKGGINRGAQIAAERQAKNGTGERTNPVQASRASHVAAAAARAEPLPSPAQIDADNARKGHFEFAEGNPLRAMGMISIETAKGVKRVHKGGQWTSPPLTAHYGHLQVAKGADGDKADITVGDDLNAKSVYVIDQINPATGKFDETKSFAGFTSRAEATKAYLASFSDDAGRRIGAVTEMPPEQFVQLARSDNLDKPVAYREPVAEPSQTLTADEIPSNLIITLPVLIEDAGETVMVEQNARKAFKAANQRVKRLTSLLDCLRAP